MQLTGCPRAEVKATELEEQASAEELMPSELQSELEVEGTRSAGLEAARQMEAARLSL